MSRLDNALQAALTNLDPKPPESAAPAEKKRYSERMSAVVALALAHELRLRGLTGTRPATPGEVGLSGAERRLAGGIGAKKVDVSFATEESGLVLGLSVKTINFRDARSKNFQKNLTNRRADMLIEAVTLHRRFPYAVLAGLFILDKAASADQTATRRSTFSNAHQRLRLFTGRLDPNGREEQFERLYVALVDATPFGSTFEAYLVGEPGAAVPLDLMFDDLVELVAERNFDFYEASDGILRPLRVRRGEEE